MITTNQTVELVWSTPSAEKIILYVARVSSDQTNEDTKLLNYLIKNKHWSPFEMAHMCVEIVTSRAIAQQILRHRSFSFQEFSHRYSEPASMIKVEPRRQAEKNRQSSTDNLNENIKLWFNHLTDKLWLDAITAYKAAISYGVAKESARFLLPAATATKLYMVGNLRSWIHYIELRTDEHTQQEHREIAFMIKDIFIDKFPTISEALWQIAK